LFSEHCISRQKPKRKLCRPPEKIPIIKWLITSNLSINTVFFWQTHGLAFAVYKKFRGKHNKSPQQWFSLTELRLINCVPMRDLIERVLGSASSCLSIRCINPKSAG
jgi:hypothetical protein